MNLTPMSISARPAQLADVDRLVQLSQQVQDVLTAAGSLQEIGPFARESVKSAIVEHRCFVLNKNGNDSIIGCALYKRNVTKDNFPDGSGDKFDGLVSAVINSSPKPWLYLHSIMLEPSVQKQGLGVEFVNQIMTHISRQTESGGTVFLDCWAGSDKLRKFYERVGFTFVQVLHVSRGDFDVAVFARPILEPRKIEIEIERKKKKGG